MVLGKLSCFSFLFCVVVLRFHCSIVLLAEVEVDLELYQSYFLFVESCLVDVYGWMEGGSPTLPQW